MKNGMDSTAVGRAPEMQSFGNRKLIRPSLPRESREAHEQTITETGSAAPTERAAKKDATARSDPRRKFLLSETNADEDPHGHRSTGW